MVNFWTDLPRPVNSPPAVASPPHTSRERLTTTRLTPSSSPCSLLDPCTAAVVFFVVVCAVLLLEESVLGKHDNLTISNVPIHPLWLWMVVESSALFQTLGFGAFGGSP